MRGPAAAVLRRSTQRLNLRMIKKKIAAAINSTGTEINITTRLCAFAFGFEKPPKIMSARNG